MLERKAASNKEEARPEHYAEIKRICALPVVLPLTPEEFTAFCLREILADAPKNEDGSDFRFFEPQAAGVCGWDMYDGMLGPIGVGWGKQLLSDMLIERDFRSGKVRRSLLLVPSQNYTQVMETDIPWARRRVPITVKFHGLGGKSAATRRAMAVSGQPGCYVMPYSLLSTRDTDEILAAIKPGLIVADEAQNLKNKDAARTKRLLEYCAYNQPRFAALSGSITGKSIKDYVHLVRLCLRDYSPLPLAQQLAEEWAMSLDSDANPSEAQTGPIQPLVRWARENFPSCPPCKGTGKQKKPNEEEVEECVHCSGTGVPAFTEDVAGFREAYKFRLVTAPGVVATGDEEIKTSITLCNAPVEDYTSCPGWPELQGHIERVHELWVTPNGDELEHAIHKFKWNYELTAGFYNELTWPTAEKLLEKGRLPIKSKSTKKNKITQYLTVQSATHAEELLAASKLHHAADQVYAKTLRTWLAEQSRPKLDTPWLVGGDMHAHGAKNVGEELYGAWRAAKDLVFPGMPERWAKAIRVCSYKVDQAVAWARSLPKGEGGLIWVHHRAMGKWCYESLVEAGLDALYCPAGAGHNEAINDHANKDKIVVASMFGHGTGKNLQHFFNQFFLQWPRNAGLAEQVLGRTHRNGQKAEELIVVTCNTLLEGEPFDFDALNFAACINDTLYAHQTIGAKRKLIYCGYDPIPAAFPPEVLRARGFKNKPLSAEQKRFMQERFARS